MASCQRILPLGEQWGEDCWSLQKPPNLAESLCPPSLLKNYPQLLSRESLCWVLGIRDRTHRLALGSWKYSCPGSGRDCNSSCLLLFMYLLTLREAIPEGPAQACSQLSTLALLPEFSVVPDWTGLSAKSSMSLAVESLWPWPYLTAFFTHTGLL